MKQYLVTFSADCNDGDMVQENHKFSQEDLDRLNRILEQLKPFHKPYGGIYFGTNEAIKPENDPERFGLSKEDLEFMEELMPFHEYGVHTLDTVTYVEIVGETVTLL